MKHPGLFHLVDAHSSRGDVALQGMRGVVSRVWAGMVGAGLSPAPTIPAQTLLTTPLIQSDAPQALRRVKSTQTALKQTGTIYISTHQ